MHDALHNNIIIRSSSGHHHHRTILIIIAGAASGMLGKNLLQESRVKGLPAAVETLGNSPHYTIFLLVCICPVPSGVPVSGCTLGQMPSGMVLKHQMAAICFPMQQKTSDVPLQLEESGLRHAPKLPLHHFIKTVELSAANPKMRGCQMLWVLLMQQYGERHQIPALRCFASQLGGFESA